MPSNTGANARRGGRAPKRDAGDLAAAYATLSPAEIDRLLAEHDTGDGTYLRTRFAGHPALYAAERLGVQWWSKQVEVAEALETHRRVLVKASHSVGKTHLAAGIALYNYEVHNPGIVLTTAPSFTQVVDLLWKEIRSQAPSGIPLMPAAPRMQDPGAEFHYAVGYTARTADSFQGRHEEKLLVIFDEAVGVRSEFWDAADGMLTSPGTRMLAICNPTDTSSPAYQADLSEDWHSITIAAPDHPNVAAELAGLPPVLPKAVRLSYIEDKVRDPAWCTPLGMGDPTLATDFEWPPHSNIWYRPGAQFEGRVLGRWPSQGISSIWSEASWEKACKTRLDEPKTRPPELGCDVARYGDDDTTIHARRGPVSLLHEAHNGWGIDRTAHRLKGLADEMGQVCGIDGRSVAIKVDDTGVGGGVVDLLMSWGYNAVGINASETAVESEGYPNRRSEMWFSVSDRALHGKLDLSRLPRGMQERLRGQAMAPKWKMDNRNRRVVEPKPDTKRRIGRSPDDMDALNLAYASASPFATATTGRPTVGVQTSPLGSLLGSLTGKIFGTAAPAPSAQSAPVPPSGDEGGDDDWEPEEVGIAVGAANPAHPYVADATDRRGAYLSLISASKRRF